MKLKYKQTYSNECGICAIKNLLNLYKIKYKDNTLKYDSDGTSVYNMVNELKKYFYRVEAISFDITQLKPLKQFKPFIYLVQKEEITHYIVIYKKTKKKLYVLDSLANKSYKLTYEQFSLIDSKQSIIAENKKELDLSLKKYKNKFIIPFISLLESLLLLSTTVLIQQIIDNGIKDAILYIFAQMFLLLITTYKIKIFLKLFKSIDNDIVLKTMKDIYGLKKRYVEKYSIDEVYYRINDAYAYKEMYLSFWFNLINDILLALCSIVLMIIYSYIIAIFMLVIDIILVIISINIFKKTCKVIEERRINEYTFFNEYRDSFKNKDVFSKDNLHYVDKSKNNLLVYQKKDYELSRLNMFKNLILLYFQTFIISLVVILYFTKLYSVISIGSLVALINLITMSLQPILNICSEITKYSNISLVKKRLKDINDNIK